MQKPRDQKSVDIARMNALTNAANLTAAMLPTLENKTEISDLVLKVAGKFANWILDGEASNSQPGQNEADQDEDRPTPPKGRGRSRPDPNAPPAEKMTRLLDMIATDPRLYLQLNEAEFEEFRGAWFQRYQSKFGASPGDPYPISKKQYGFLMGLHKETGFEPDTRLLMGLSTDGASKMIDLLGSLKGNGKASGRQAQESPY